MSGSLPGNIKEKMAGNLADRNWFLWEICLHHLKKLSLKLHIMFDSFFVSYMICRIMKSFFTC